MVVRAAAWTVSVAVSTFPLWVPVTVQVAAAVGVTTLPTKLPPLAGAIVKVVWAVTSPRLLS